MEAELLPGGYMLFPTARDERDSFALALHHQPWTCKEPPVRKPGACSHRGISLLMKSRRSNSSRL